VTEALLAEPGGCLPATDLLALFRPRDEVERQKLTIAISRVCELLPKTMRNLPTFRLRKVAPRTGRCAAGYGGAGSNPGSCRSSPTAATSAAGGGRRSAPSSSRASPAAAVSPTGAAVGRPSRGSARGSPKAFVAPLEISSTAIIDALARAPEGWMEAARLRALFQPRGEAERQLLTVAIAEVADLEFAPVGARLEHINERRLVGVLKLKPQFAPVSRPASHASLGSASSPRGQTHHGARPNGAARANSPSARAASPAARTSARRADAAPRAVGRPAPGARPVAGPVAAGRAAAARPAPGRPSVSSASAAARGTVPGARAEPPPTPAESAWVGDALASCPGGRVRADGLVALLAPASETEKRRLALAVAAVARVVELSDGRGGAISYFVPRSAGVQAPAHEHYPWLDGYEEESGPRSPEAAEEEEVIEEARLDVSESNVLGLLTRVGGRMRSDALIARFEPLAPAERRKLSEHVRSLAKVTLKQNCFSTEGLRTGERALRFTLKIKLWL